MVEAESEFKIKKAFDKVVKDTTSAVTSTTNNVVNTVTDTTNNAVNTVATTTNNVVNTVTDTTNNVVNNVIDTSTDFAKAVASGSAVAIGTVYEYATPNYKDAYKWVVTTTNQAHGGLVKSADWTFNKVKSGADYDMKMYAMTLYKYG